MFKAMFLMKVATSEGANKLYANSGRIGYPLHTSVELLEVNESRKTSILTQNHLLLPLSDMKP